MPLCSCRSTLSSVPLAARQRNAAPQAAASSAVAARVTAARSATEPVSRRSAYGGREKPMTVSQPMKASGTAAVGSATAASPPTTTAHAISTPVAPSRPSSAAATVPMANSAAKPAGSA